MGHASIRFSDHTNFGDGRQEGTYALKHSDIRCEGTIPSVIFAMETLESVGK